MENNPIQINPQSVDHEQTYNASIPGDIHELPEQIKETYASTRVSTSVIYATLLHLKYQCYQRQITANAKTHVLSGRMNHALTMIEELNSQVKQNLQEIRQIKLQWLQTQTLLQTIMEQNASFKTALLKIIHEKTDVVRPRHEYAQQSTRNTTSNDQWYWELDGTHMAQSTTSATAQTNQLPSALPPGAYTYATPNQTYQQGYAQDFQ